MTGLLLTGSGCKTERQPDPLAQAVEIGERPVAMSGTSNFFGGQLNVIVTISRGIGHGTEGQGGAGGKQKSGKQAPPDYADLDNDQLMAYIQAKAAVGSPMPPVTLRLKIENKAMQTIAVDVLDFESDLGNFAVNPETLSMAPNQTAEPDPMISQLGVTSDEIPIKVSLKSAGKTETQTIVVKSLLGSQPPAK
jgi:hypothetical protein